MHPAYSSTFTVGHRRIAERHHRQPLGGSRQPAQRVLFVPRVLHHSGERSGVQGLHQQRPDSPNERGQGPVHRPRRGARAKITGINSAGQLSHPFGGSFRITGNDATEPLGYSSSRHIDGAGHGKHAVRVPSDRVSRTLTWSPSTNTPLRRDSWRSRVPAPLGVNRRCELFGSGQRHRHVLRPSIAKNRQLDGVSGCIGSNGHDEFRRLGDDVAIDSGNDVTVLQSCFVRS